MSEEKVQSFFQQGDVLFHRVGESRKSTPGTDVNLSGVSPVRGRLIFAEGEVHGHAHAVTVSEELEDKVFMWREEDNLMFSNAVPVTVEHEEHKEIELPPGTWKIDQVREFDHTEGVSRRVID